MLCHADGSCGRCMYLQQLACRGVCGRRRPRTNGGPRNTAPGVGLRHGGEARRRRSPDSEAVSSLSSGASPAPAGEGPAVAGEADRRRVHRPLNRWSRTRTQQDQDRRRASEQDHRRASYGQRQLPKEQYLVKHSKRPLAPGARRREQTRRASQLLSGNWHLDRTAGILPSLQSEIFPFSF